jgi:hypothetical protein
VQRGEFVRQSRQLAVRFAEGSERARFDGARGEAPQTLERGHQLGGPGVPRVRGAGHEQAVEARQPEDPGSLAGDTNGVRRGHLAEDRRECVDQAASDVTGASAIIGRVHRRSSTSSSPDADSAAPGFA